MKMFIGVALPVVGLLLGQAFGWAGVLAVAAIMAALWLAGTVLVSTHGRKGLA